MAQKGSTGHTPRGGGSYNRPPGSTPRELSQSSSHSTHAAPAGAGQEAVRQSNTDAGRPERRARENVQPHAASSLSAGEAPVIGNQARQGRGLSELRSINARGTQNYGENRGMRRQTDEQMQIRRQTAMNVQKEAAKTRYEADAAAEESLHQQSISLHQEAQGVHEQAAGLHGNDAAHTGSRLERFVDLGSKREQQAESAHTHKSGTTQYQQPQQAAAPASASTDKLKKKKKKPAKSKPDGETAQGRTGLQRKVDLSMKREKLAEASGTHSRGRQTAQKKTAAGQPGAKDLKKQIRHESVKNQTRQRKTQADQVKKEALAASVLTSDAALQTEKPKRTRLKQPEPEAVRPVEAKAYATGQTTDFTAKSAHGKQKVHETVRREDSRLAKSAVHPDHRHVRATPRQLLSGKPSEEGARSIHGVRHLHDHQQIRSSHDISRTGKKPATPRQVQQSKRAAIANFRKRQAAAKGQLQSQLLDRPDFNKPADPIRRKAAASAAQPGSSGTAQTAAQGAALQGAAAQARTAAVRTQMRRKSTKKSGTGKSSAMTAEERQEKRQVRRAREIAGLATAASAVKGLASDLKKTASVEAKNGNAEGAVIDRMADQLKTNNDRARKMAARMIAKGWEKRRQAKRTETLRLARNQAAALQAERAGAGTASASGVMRPAQPTGGSVLGGVLKKTGHGAGALAKKAGADVGKAALKGTGKTLKAGADAVLDAPKSASGVGPATSAEGKVAEKLEEGIKKAGRDAAAGAVKGASNLLKQKRLDKAAAKQAENILKGVRPRDASPARGVSRDLPSAKEVVKNFKMREMLSKARQKKVLEQAAQSKASLTKAADTAKKAANAKKLTQKAASRKAAQKQAQKAMQKKAAQSAAGNAGKGLFSLNARTEIIKTPMLKWFSTVAGFLAVIVLLTMLSSVFSFASGESVDVAGIGGLIREEDAEGIGNMWKSLRSDFEEDVNEEYSSVLSYYQSMTGPKDELNCWIRWNDSDDGEMIDNFLDVLAIYAWEKAFDTHGEKPIDKIDATQIDAIREIYLRMNVIDQPPTVYETDITEPVLDADGNPTGETVVVGTKRDVILCVHNYKLHDQYVKDEFGYDDDTIQLLHDWIQPPSEKARLLWEVLADPIMEILGMTFEQAGGSYNYSNIMGILPYGSAGAVLQECQKYVGWIYSQDVNLRMATGYADCSSFVYRVFKAFGVDFGGNTTSGAEHQWCDEQGLTFWHKSNGPVDISSWQPGDVIFWSLNGYNGQHENTSHVGIYAGNNSVYEASSSAHHVVYREFVQNPDKVIAVARLISSTQFTWDGSLTPMNAQGQILTGDDPHPVTDDFVQSGICGEYTGIYDQSWTGLSGQIYQQWLARGAQFDGHLAVMDGCYLVAVSPERVCSEGYRITIILEGGIQIPAITLDEKGQDRHTKYNDYTEGSYWGHKQSGGYSLVEWEASGVCNPDLMAKGWYGRKVVDIRVHGRWM
ncbi:MAG: hypothetical protein HDQ87_06305 [Clostridia bacterium]|nr:hypothetical protein [Clostridia bacterium]